MWAMSKSILLLLLIAATPVANAADDLTKLKAALAERFSRYQSLSVKYETSGSDPSDPNRTIGVEYLWDRKLPYEKFETNFLPPEKPNRSVVSSDGRELQRITFPDVDPTGISATPRANVTTSPGSELGVGPQANVLEAVLGLRFSAIPDGWPGLLKVSITRLPDETTANGRVCPAFAVTTVNSTEGQVESRIVVDPQWDWLPVVMENRFAVGMHRFTEVMTVTEIMRVRDERFGDDLVFPRVAEGWLTIDDVNNSSPATSPLRVHITACILNPKFDSVAFHVPIPDGSYVQTIEPGKVMRTSVSGGVPAAGQVLAEYQAGHERQLRSFGSQRVTASPPAGGIWTKTVLIVSVALLVSAIYLYRRASQ